MDLSRNASRFRTLVAALFGLALSRVLSSFYSEAMLRKCWIDYSMLKAASANKTDSTTFSSSALVHELDALVLQVQDKVGDHMSTITHQSTCWSGQMWVGRYNWSMLTLVS